MSLPLNFDYLKELSQCCQVRILSKPEVGPVHVKKRIIASYSKEMSCGKVLMSGKISNASYVNLADDLATENLSGF
jgi:hypothetical protein